jgi:hypothetical protein
VAKEESLSLQQIKSSGDKQLVQALNDLTGL